MSAKEELFAIFHAAKKADQELNLAKLSIVLDTPEVKLKAWVAKYEADYTRESIQAEAGPELVINENGVIEVVESQLTRISDFKGAGGLQLLHAEVQATAGTLVTRIADMAEQELNPRDLVSLTSALTSLQQAFFNRPVTNIQINGNEGKSLLSSFQDRLQA